VGGFFCRTIFEPIKLFAYDDLPREKNTNQGIRTLQRRLVRPFAGYGVWTDFADMSGPRSLWGFRPTGRRLGDTLRLNHTGRPLVDAILNSSLSYMRLVFFDSAVKGQNLLKSSIRIMEI
jgi:hypothetical protein